MSDEPRLITQKSEHGEAAMADSAARTSHQTPAPGPPECPLTARELRVLRAYLDGHSVQGAAGILQISASTVNRHMDNLRRKLEVHNVAEAVEICVRNAWI